jgi:hypothetical protein
MRNVTYIFKKLATTTKFLCKNFNPLIIFRNKLNRYFYHLASCQKLGQTTWKGSGAESATVERVQMNHQFQSWMNHVAQLFGGLDICVIKAIQSNDGSFYIINVNGSDFTSMRDSLEEDCISITELVIKKLTKLCSATDIEY